MALRETTGQKNRRAYYQTQHRTQGLGTLARMPVFRLAIASPLRRLFDYLPPEHWDEKALANLRPGVRLIVPFGKRKTCAVLVETSGESNIEADKLRRVIEVVDESPLISRQLIRLCHWAANYYKAPVGEILAAALPTALRRGKHYSGETVRHWQLSSTGLGLPEGALKRAPRQAELLARLQQEAALSDLRLKALGASVEARRQLQAKGLIEAIELPPPAPTPQILPGPELNEDQQRAVQTIGRQMGQFGCFLLQGVTGSGKTEVYLRLASLALQQNRQVLVLVPEIGLTPQTIHRFEQRFSTPVATLHSGLAEGARLQAWDQARSGRAAVVLGTRSAVFSSLARPGLIIVDEEHDGSFKQQDGLRYSARDMAVKRGQIEKIPVVLGSATPSLETLHNVASGRYRKLVLPSRVGGGNMPVVKILDIRRQPLQAGLCQELLAATGVELAAGNQVLLFLNRRGFAPALQCHDCGMTAQCMHCDARVTVHRQARQLRCHHCEWRKPLPDRCPECHSRHLFSRGLGTEQVESALQACYPELPIHRVDRDSMGGRRAMERLWREVSRGDPCILLGTQMLTKGHHFPDVTLVGLIDTDAALFSADFRGPERMGQLLTQVGGRAGRAEKAGRVILQTHYPDHPLLKILLQQGYEGFARHLLEERSELGLPPYCQLLLLRAEANRIEAAEAFLRDVCGQLGAPDSRTVKLVGPLPAPMQRKGGRFRAQLLLVCRSRRSAQYYGERLVSLAETLPAGKRLRWSLDVDPLDMV